MNGGCELNMLPVLKIDIFLVRFDISIVNTEHAQITDIALLETKSDSC